MYAGSSLFAQMMDFLLWTTFTRIVSRYGGDHRVRTPTCAEHVSAMAFAQLTCREGLRDIETCMRPHQANLYHLGIRGRIAKSTLADANQLRDWCISVEFAQTLTCNQLNLLDSCPDASDFLSFLCYLQL